MTNAAANNQQRSDLLYDFYDRRLWLTRFFSINDSISSTMGLCINALGTIDGLTIEKVRQLVQDSGQTEQEHFKELLLVLSEEHILTDSSTELSGRFSPDLDFEVRQLLNLYTFSCSLRIFVEQTLYGAIDAALSPREQTLPPVALMRRCFQQVSVDFELIQRAITQRRWVSPGHEMGPGAEALLVTDKLAWMALAPAQRLLPPVDHFILPITFFSEKTYIHRVPYSTNLLLIGISYDHISLGASNVRQWMARGGYSNMHPGLEELADETLPAFELMAIPHEVGHYVYRHARIDGQKPFACISDHSIGLPYDEWCEEIFADIYACLMAGPLTPLGLQSLLASSDTDAICVNDGSHPTAIVRPFILSEILSVLTELRPDVYSFSEVATRLNENWAAILLYQGYRVVDGQAGDGRCVLRSHDTGEVVNIAEALEAVRPIIDTFANQLLAHGDFSAVDDTPWSNKDFGNLKDYDQEMANLTNQAFASKYIGSHRLVALEQSVPQDLQRLLIQWGDNGPSGTGGGTRP